MPDDSTIHHALAIGAMALAIAGGSAAAENIAPDPLTEAPAAVEMLPADPVLTAFPEIPAEAWNYSQNPAAGPEPTRIYNVFLKGPGLDQAIPVVIPERFAWATQRMAPPAVQPDESKPQIAVTFQPAAAGLRYTATANLDDMSDKVATLLNQQVDLTGVTHIDIRLDETSPKPAPEPQSESKERFGFAVEVLSAIASMLEIGTKVAERQKRKASAEGATTTATAADIAGWSEAEGRMLIDLAARMRMRFELWRSATASGVESEATRDLESAFCADLRRLRAFLLGKGRGLTGFEPIEIVCAGAPGAIT